MNRILLAKSKQKGRRDISLVEHTKAVINTACRIVDVLVPEERSQKIKEQIVQAAALHDIGKCLRKTQEFFSKMPSKSKIDEESSEDTSEIVSADGRPPKHNVVSWAYAKTYCKLSDAVLSSIIHHHIIQEKSSMLDSSFILSDDYKDDVKTMHTFFEEISYYVNSLFNRTILKRSNVINRKAIKATDVSPFSLIAGDFHVNSFNDAADMIVVRAILIYADRIVSSYPDLSFDVSQNIDDALIKLIPSFRADFPNFDIRNCSIYDKNRLTAQLDALDKITNTDISTSVLSANAGFGKTLVGLLYILKLKKRAYWVAPQNNIARESYNSIVEELNTMGLKDKVSVALLLSGTYEEGTPDADIIVTNIDNFFNPAVRNNDAMNYLAEIASTVVFDEYHNFITRNAMFAMFIQLMYSRFHHMKSNTLLMSATPMYFKKFFWSKNTVQIIEPPLFNCSMNMKITVKYINSLDEINPKKDSFVILPTVDEVQKAYKSFKENNPSTTVSIIHAHYKDADRKRLECMIHATHGKKSNIHLRQTVFSSNMISTGLDVSANIIYDFPFSPECTIQKGCGRAGRFLNEYKEVEYILCIMKQRSLGMQAIIRDNYDFNLLSKWENILKGLDGQTITKKEMYDRYRDFYKVNANDVEKIQAHFFLESNKELCDLRPYAIKVKDGNRDVLSSRTSWRGPGNTIYTISKRIGSNKPTEIVKMTIRSIEYLEQEWSVNALKARRRFIERRSKKFKDKFKYGNVMITKDTYFSYARNKETPFYLYKSYYDDELGLVLK